MVSRATLKIGAHGIRSWVLTLTLSLTCTLTPSHTLSYPRNTLTYTLALSH